jgi:Arc/MetJ-type ribon-helix-helix transcriptional regulator
MNLISIRLPADLMKSVDKMARKRKQNRSEFIRSALENALSVEDHSKPVGLTEVRDELLLAVGQLGDSLRQLPKFIKQETNELTAQTDKARLTKESLPIDALKQPPKPTEQTDLDNQLFDVPDEISPIEIMAVEESNPARSGRSLGRTQTHEGSPMDDIFLGWSTNREVPAELSLRPREESFDYVPDQPVPLSDYHPKPQNETGAEIATLEGWNGETDRRRGQTKGRPIGEERRQSIRLARVLAYKKWNAERLAQRLKMPIEMIRDAIEGREDLASLKVEALLSTWEEEMKHVGWTPDS